ncbi:MAG: response regulator [Aggregatilineales bacterium]
MKYRLMVIDDESPVRRLVAYTLRSLDIEVIGAENGAEALQLAEQYRLDMILVDINLPEMDGFSVIERLRSLPALAEVPVITVTARSHQGDEARARSLGASDFFYKPFSTQELRSLAQRFLLEKHNERRAT